MSETRDCRDPTPLQDQRNSAGGWTPPPKVETSVSLSGCQGLRTLDYHPHRPPKRHYHHWLGCHAFFDRTLTRRNLTDRNRAASMTIARPGHRWVRASRSIAGNLSIADGVLFMDGVPTRGVSNGQP